MTSLFILNETITNGFSINALDFLCLSAILSGILVIISKNPIISVLFLICLFSSIATYLIASGISFIGLSYLLVYIGAVSILFLFILMLINVRISELFSDTSNSIPLAFIVAISFTYCLSNILPYSISVLNNYSYNIYNKIWNGFHSYFLGYIIKTQKIYDNTEINFVTSKMWDGNMAVSSHISSIGNIIYTSYAIWLVVTSIILLLAMVGSIVITIKTTK